MDNDEKKLYDDFCSPPKGLGKLPNLNNYAENEFNGTVRVMSYDKDDRTALLSETETAVRCWYHPLGEHQWSENISVPYLQTSACKCGAIKYIIKK